MSKNFATLYDHIVALDGILTGKDERACGHNARNQAHVFEDILHFVECRTAYYLADYGYSRVYLTDEGGIFLTSNSREPVKEKWETQEAQEVIETFRSAVMDLYSQAWENAGATMANSNPSI